MDYLEIFSALFLISLANSSSALQYGMHVPQGVFAVWYICGPDGTWKELVNLKYNWNYHQKWATPNHPYDPDGLVNEANGAAMCTTRDANGFLLCDFDQDLEIYDETILSGQYAFHEHNGRGENGAQRGNPLTNFWFDDNWLARYMSAAYGTPPPYGLQEQPNKFMRWKPIGGDTTYWSPYNDPNHVDTLCLDGLYYFLIHDTSTALNRWDSALSKGLPSYDAYNQQYRYGGYKENYHLCLVKILTDFLLSSSKFSPATKDRLLQHSVALRSQILDYQEKSPGGTPIGWTTGIPAGTTLINTETVACCALALGAHSHFIFESDRSPMINPADAFIRPYHAVSAVVGLTKNGFLSVGPNWAFPVGTYQVDFVMRCPSPVDGIAVLYAIDVPMQRTLAERVVYAQDFYASNKWSVVSFIFSVTSTNTISFAVGWTAISNLDVAYVKCLRK